MWKAIRSTKTARDLISENGSRVSGSVKHSAQVEDHTSPPPETPTAALAMNASSTVSQPATKHRTDSFSDWRVIQNFLDELLFPGCVCLTIISMLFGKKGFQLSIGAD